MKSGNWRSGARQPRRKSWILSRDSIRVAENAGTLLDRIIPDIQHTAELVQGISAASAEQRSGVQQINAAVFQLDKVVQVNASSSEELASMSEELSSQSDQMISTMAFFRVDQEARKVIEDKTRTFNTGRKIEEGISTLSRGETNQLIANTISQTSERAKVSGGEDEFEEF